MKRISLAIMALTILMALTQCKKQEQTSSESGETVFVSLKVGGSNGSKADVNPNMGTVVFTQGDVVYVSSDGKFVGTLTHNGNTFSGNITNPLVGQPLYFYFFGNKTPVETLSEGSSTQCSVLVSDQTTGIPVISCGPSHEVFTGSGLYTAFFYNKCALVKFDVAASSTSATCLTGLNNKVIVDFANNNVSYGQENNGLIKLNAGNGEKWAILLPQAAMEVGDEGSAYSEDGNYMGVRPAIPAITENGYLTEGIAVSLQSSASEVPEGAINGLFTVNANGDQVYFSKGNLQYIGSAAVPYWKFADNQWDYFGDNGQNDSYIHRKRDLFGWGTSGWDCGNTYYEPWDVGYLYYGGQYHVWSQSAQYGPLENNNLTGNYSNSDWGVYNAISNGGNQSNLWRTLTSEEWIYVFHTRNTPSGIRFAKAQVNNVNGVILLPDDWNSSVFQFYDNANESWAEYSSNVINISQWNTLQSAGAVFLPSTGMRTSNASGYPGYLITISINSLDLGYYWSSTCSSDQSSSIADRFSFYFSNSGCSIGTVSRGCGLAVRLVQDYNP